MTDLNSLEKFNQFYSLEKDRTYESSLKDFFQAEVRSRLLEASPNILDLGPGSKSLFEDLEFTSVTAIDFSSVAIEKAGLQAEVQVNYQLRDITKENSIEKESYDLIFDSHCLHCIEDESLRKIAFQNIYSGLKPNGIFCAEMMTSAGKNECIIPFKYVRSSLVLEEEILSYGFKINYFMIVRDLKFENANGKCDLLRVIGRK